MIPNYLTKLFGPSWRTTLSGSAAAFMSLLSLVAALPQELGTVADIISPAYKARVFAVAAVAALVLRLVNASQQKDKQVTGGSVLNVPTPAPPQTAAGKS